MLPSAWVALPFGASGRSASFLAVAKQRSASLWEKGLWESTSSSAIKPKRFVLATGRTIKRFRDSGQRRPIKARDKKEALHFRRWQFQGKRFPFARRQKPKRFVSSCFYGEALLLAGQTGNLLLPAFLLAGFSPGRSASTSGRGALRSAGSAGPKRFQLGELEQRAPRGGRPVEALRSRHR